MQESNIIFSLPNHAEVCAEECTKILLKNIFTFPKNICHGYFRIFDFYEMTMELILDIPCSEEYYDSFIHSFIFFDIHNCYNSNIGTSHII
jgi:hypothetical protein